MALHKIIIMLVYAAALCVPFSNADSCSDVVLSRLGSNCDRLSRDAVSSFIVAAGPSGTFSPSGCDCGSTAQIVSFIFSGWPQQLERNNQTINNATLLAWQQYFAVQSANVVYWKFSSVAPPEKSRVAQTVLSLRCQLGLGECVSPALTAGRVFLQVNINVNPVAIHTFSVQYAAPDEYYIWMGYAQTFDIYTWIHQIPNANRNFTRLSPFAGRLNATQMTLFVDGLAQLTDGTLSIGEMMRLWGELFWMDVPLPLAADAIEVKRTAGLAFWAINYDEANCAENWNTIAQTAWSSAHRKERETMCVGHEREIASCQT